jgi:hypothetical protein
MASTRAGTLVYYDWHEASHPLLRYPAGFPIIYGATLLDQ